MVRYQRLNTFFADYAKNISRGGTFVATTEPLPPDTEFVFSLAVPELEEPLQLRAKVMWTTAPEAATKVHPAGMGIQFQYKDAEERRRTRGAHRAADRRSPRAAPRGSHPRPRGPADTLASVRADYGLGLRAAATFGGSLGLGSFWRLVSRSRAMVTSTSWIASLPATSRSLSSARSSRRARHRHVEGGLHALDAGWQPASGAPAPRADRDPRPSAWRSSPSARRSGTVPPRPCRRSSPSSAARAA